MVFYATINDCVFRPRHAPPGGGGVGGGCGGGGGETYQLGGLAWAAQKEPHN